MLLYYVYTNYERIPFDKTKIYKRERKRKIEMKETENEERKRNSGKKIKRKR